MDPLHHARSIHCKSVVHVAAHWLLKHLKSPQSWGVVTHFPKPSQELPVTALWAAPVPSVHWVAPQAVPALCSAQAPEPLHMPSRPQVVEDSDAQSLPGSVPALIGPQIPLAPDSLSDAAQAIQTSPHCALQQTASTQ
jgi:hypothetical protein